MKYLCCNILPTLAIKKVDFKSGVASGAVSVRRGPGLGPAAGPTLGSVRNI